MEEGDEKQTRLPLMMQSTYRSSSSTFFFARKVHKYSCPFCFSIDQIDQMGEDLKTVPNMTGHSTFLPLMSQPPYSRRNHHQFV